MDECKGCKIYNSCEYRPRSNYIFEGVIYKCPCHECLIKGMCNRRCEEFTNYMISFSKISESIPYVNT